VSFPEDPKSSVIERPKSPLVANYKELWEALGGQFLGHYHINSVVNPAVFVRRLKATAILSCVNLKSLGFTLIIPSVFIIIIIINRNIHADHFFVEIKSMMLSSS
jgi:hypothetical protein